MQISIIIISTDRSWAGMYGILIVVPIQSAFSYIVLNRLSKG